MFTIGAEFLKLAPASTVSALNTPGPPAVVVPRDSSQEPRVHDRRRAGTDLPPRRGRDGRLVPRPDTGGRRGPRPRVPNGGGHREVEEQRAGAALRVAGRSGHGVRGREGGVTRGRAAPPPEEGTPAVLSRGRLQEAPSPLQCPAKVLGLLPSRRGAAPGQLLPARERPAMGPHQLRRAPQLHRHSSTGARAPNHHDFPHPRVPRAGQLHRRTGGAGSGRPRGERAPGKRGRRAVGRPRVQDWRAPELVEAYKLRGRHPNSADCASPGHVRGRRGHRGPGRNR